MYPGRSHRKKVEDLSEFELSAEHAAALALYEVEHPETLQLAAAQEMYIPLICQRREHFFQCALQIGTGWDAAWFAVSFAMQAKL